MSTNPTPCQSCVRYQEVYSPMPGEPWNRCNHPDREIECNPKYACPVNSWGYATSKCEHFDDSISTYVITLPRVVYKKYEACGDISKIFIILIILGLMCYGMASISWDVRVILEWIGSIFM